MKVFGIQTLDHHASLQFARAYWLRCSGGRGFTLASWCNYVL